MKGFLITYTNKEGQGGIALVIATNKETSKTVLLTSGIFASIGYNIFEVSEIEDPTISRYCGQEAVLKEVVASKGPQGELGVPGPKLTWEDIPIEERRKLIGPKGEDGNTPTIQAIGGANINKEGTPTVSTTLNNGTYTIVFNYLKGAKGDTGPEGPLGKGLSWDDIPENERNLLTGPAGRDGAKGADGQTPYIGSNGNWFIGNNDTGVHAQGPKGLDGTDGNSGTLSAVIEDRQTQTITLPDNAPVGTILWITLLYGSTVTVKGTILNFDRTPLSGTHSLDIYKKGTVLSGYADSSTDWGSGCDVYAYIKTNKGWILMFSKYHNQS